MPALDRADHELFDFGGFSTEQMKKRYQGIIDAQLDLVKFSINPPGCRTASGIESLKEEPIAQ